MNIKKIPQIAFLILLLSESFFHLSAQSIIIKGKLISQDNTPIAYARVDIPNYKMGTTTQESGDFLLECTKEMIEDTILILYSHHRRTYIVNFPKGKDTIDIGEILLFSDEAKQIPPNIIYGKTFEKSVFYIESVLKKWETENVEYATKLKNSGYSFSYKIYSSIRGFSGGSFVTLDLSKRGWADPSVVITGKTLNAKDSLPVAYALIGFDKYGEMVFGSSSGDFSLQYPKALLSDTFCIEDPYFIPLNIINLPKDTDTIEINNIFLFSPEIDKIPSPGFYYLGLDSGYINEIDSIFAEWQKKYPDYSAKLKENGYSFFYWLFSVKWSGKWQKYGYLNAVLDLSKDE